MDPVAILITKENCNEYRTELRHALKVPNGYEPSFWIGYYLVVDENGPEIMTATRFANTYNLASVKQQYATLLTLRRQALIDLLDTRERLEACTDDIDTDDHDDLQLPGELFTALDNAVKEFRTALIKRVPSLDRTDIYSS